MSAHPSAPRFRAVFPGSVVALLLVSMPAAATLDAYVTPVSVVQGGAVSLHVSSSHGSFDIVVERLGAAEVEVFRQDGIPGFEQVTPDSAWTGCEWAPATILPVDPAWPSGVYRVTCRPSEPSSDFAYAMFTVLEDDPGSTARILFQNSVATWQAYNAWGGRSFYEVQSPSGERATTISFERPHLLRDGMGTFAYWEWPLIRWLEGEGFAVEYATDLDSHADPGLEAFYDVFVIAGHDEYWSKEMFDRIEARVAAGRDVAVFGGNTCWWQVRFSPELDQVTCYKIASWDPLYGIDDERVTVHWHDPPVLRPANTWSGASLLHGGDPDVGNNAYTVRRPEHWVFEGTGLQTGEEFGGAQQVAGNEVDGARLTWTGGFPVPTGEDGTPLHFEILATSPASQGWATLGILEGPSATVFNAASITWSWGLQGNPVVQRITRNVLEGLADGDPYAPRAGSLEISELAVNGSGDNVRIYVHVTNPSPSETSRRATLAVDARPLGGNPLSACRIVDTEIEPLAPGATKVLNLAVTPDELPPDAELRVAGTEGPVQGCPIVKPWRGELAVSWTESGLAPEAHAEGWADLPVCPGDAGTVVRVDVRAEAPLAWAFDPPPPGWSAALVLDSDGNPGEPAPVPLPPGDFEGWIVIEADAGVPFGEEAEIVWWRDIGAEPIATVLAGLTCDRNVTAVSVTPAPVRFGLDPPRPNPARGAVDLAWSLPRAGPVRVIVSDVAGRTVHIVWDGVRSAGRHTVTWNGRLESGRHAPAGVYFVRLEQGAERDTRKVVLTR